MGNAKVHWVDPGLWSDDLPESVCGVTHVPFTKYPERITCKICRMVLTKAWQDGDVQDNMVMSTGGARPIIK